MTDNSMEATLRGLIGAPSRQRRTGADPVSAAQVRLWREAMGDVASPCTAEVPRAMLAAFSGRRLAEARGAGDDIGMLTQALGGHGLLPAGVGIAQTYHRDIRIGDTITEVTEIESVSPRKRTRLGEGWFLTLLTRFSDQTEADVGQQRLTVFAFPAGGARTMQSTPSSPAADVGVEALPPLAITLDRTGMILCTVACGDYAVGHYDPDIARAQGFEDVFTDVYTGIGLAHRYATAAGGRVRSIDLKLGASFYAGDTLTLTGAVIARDGNATTIGIQGHCRTGLHLSGSAELVRE